MNCGALGRQLGQVRVLIALRILLPPWPVGGWRPGQISLEKPPAAVAAEVFVNAAVDTILPQELPVLLMVPVVPPAG